MPANMVNPRTSLQGTLRPASRCPLRGPIYGDLSYYRGPEKSFV